MVIKMTTNEFNIIVDKQLEECLKCLTVKTKEYVLDNNDRLRAFKLVWIKDKEIKVNPKITLWGQMVKHISSIYDMCLKDEAYDKENYDKWKEKITDIINYLILLRGIIEDICKD